MTTSVFDQNMYEYLTDNYAVTSDYDLMTSSNAVTSSASASTTLSPLQEHVPSFEIVLPTVFCVLLVLAFNLVVFHTKTDVIAPQQHADQQV